VVSLISPDEAKFAARAAFYEIPVHEYIANDGKIFSKQSYVIGDGRTIQTRRAFYNDLETGPQAERYGHIVENVREAPGAQDTKTWKVPSSVSSAVSAILTGKNEAWAKLHAGDEEDHKKLREEFNRTHVGQAQLVTPKIKDSFGGPLLSWAFGDEYGLLVLPPTARLSGFKKDGKTDFFYYDEPTGQVYDSQGFSMDVGAFIRNNGYEIATSAPPPSKPIGGKPKSDPTAGGQGSKRVLPPESMADLAEQFEVKGVKSLDDVVKAWIKLSGRNIHIEDESKIELIKEFIKKSMTPPQTDIGKDRN
jgi:hypothetical protein